MADSASIQILLNAGGNLGSVVDQATGKVLNLGKAAKGAGAAVSAETRVAGQSFATLGEQASRAFGSAGSGIAKFAGPLGALGGVAAVAGMAVSTALDLAMAKFQALREEPIRLAESLRDAAKAANELAKARDATISGNVGKLGSVAEPLIAQGGERTLALARQISTDTGVPLDEVAKVVAQGGQTQADGRPGLGDESLRRIVEAAKLVRQSGRMSFEAAAKAGIANRTDAGFSAPEVAADMVNREAFAAHQSSVITDRKRELEAHNRAQDAARVAFEQQRQEAYSRAQLAWNLGGQQGDRPGLGPEFVPARFSSQLRFRPAVTAADFAGMQGNLDASPLVGAVEAQRAAHAAQADLALQDVSDRGPVVVEAETARARIERMHPGLQAFAAEDAKLAQEQEIKRVSAESWSQAMPYWMQTLPGVNAVRDYQAWSEWRDMKKIADDRARRSSAFFSVNEPTTRVESTEAVDAFLARDNAERAKLEAAGKAAGVPFGAGTAAIEKLLAEIARNTATQTPAPVQAAQ